MDKKLDFNEFDALNATWSCMKSIKAKNHKDASDGNTMAKCLQSITAFVDMKRKHEMFKEKNNGVNTKILLLDDSE